MSFPAADEAPTASQLMVAAAVDYLRDGFVPLPIVAGRKQPPCFKWSEIYGYDRASGTLKRPPTEDDVRSWAVKFPGYNLALLTGRAGGLDVIDPDMKPGQNGIGALAELEAELGPLPAGPTQTTANGGRHHPYRPVERSFPIGGTVTQLADDVDTRLDGNYIIVEPSVLLEEKNEGGEWVRLPEPRYWTWDRERPLRKATLPELPPAWQERLLALKGGTNGTSTRSQKIEKMIPLHERNSTLTSLAGSMRRRGAEEAEILAALLTMNTGRCDPPLPEKEVRAIAASVSGYEAGPPGPPAPKPWGAPMPVPNDLPPVPAFDEKRLLPAAFGPWVNDIAVRAQCPPDFVAVAAIGAAAAVVGRQIAVRPKRQDDWAVVPNVWGLAIGRPGIMKSPALQEAIRPVERLIAEAIEAYKEALEVEELRAFKAEVQGELVKKKLKAAVTNGESVDALWAAYKAFEVPAPTERRFLVNDSTVEKLGELLNENPNGLILHRDELSGWLALMDREGHENDRAFYCEAWNGTGSYTYDRIGRGTIRIEAACVSVLGGIQPGPLQAYLREVFGRGATDDGMIQRFQLMVYPDITGDWQNVDRWPDTEAKNNVFAIFRRLADLDITLLGATQEPEALPFLRFSADAQEVFDAWRTDLERRLRAANDHAVITSHLAKYRSLFPSLALVFHLIDSDKGGPISKSAAQRAEAWCAYLEAHARRVYQSVTAVGTTSAAFLAAKLAKGELPSPFRARSVRHKGWTGLSDIDTIGLALDLLEDLGWVRQITTPRTPKGGRPTVEYLINPAVFAPSPPRGSVGSGGASLQEKSPARARNADQGASSSPSSSPEDKIPLLADTQNLQNSLAGESQTSGGDPRPADDWDEV